MFEEVVQWSWDLSWLISHWALVRHPQNLQLNWAGSLGANECEEIQISEEECGGRCPSWRLDIVGGCINSQVPIDAAPDTIDATIFLALSFAE